MQGNWSDDILGTKKMNYDFLLLVRDKKYTQALSLGKKILQTNPDNPSVQKFCAFIEKNNAQIMKMVQKQKEEEEYEYADSDEEWEEEDQESQNDKKEVQDEKSEESSDEENESQEEQIEQQDQKIEDKENKQKLELTTCTLNQIPHICPRYHREKKVQHPHTASTQHSLQKQQ